MGCGYNASCSCGFGKHKAKPGDAPPPMPQGGQRMSEQYQSIDAVPIFNDSDDPQTGQRQSLSVAPGGQRPVDPNAPPRFSQDPAQPPLDGQQNGPFPPGDPNALPGSEAPQTTVTNLGGNQPQPGQEQPPYNPDPNQQPYNPDQQQYNQNQQYNQQYNPQQ